MWVYILIGILALYALYKEREALGCPTIPNGEDCNNQEGKAVKGTRASPYDTEIDLFLKLKRAGSYKDRFVFWRVALLSSIVCSFVIWFILYRRIPSEWELVVLIVVISSVTYFTDNFYKFHLVDHVKKNIEEIVDIMNRKYSRYKNEIE